MFEPEVFSAWILETRMQSDNGSPVVMTIVINLILVLGGLLIIREPMAIGR